MSLPRFFVDLPLVAASELPLPTDIAHHAVRVLRLQDGDELVIFNGLGGQYPARLRVAGKAASAELRAFDPREAELPARIVLAQALPSGDKMDWVIEKAVEMGVAAVQPIAASRCVLKLSGERLEKRLAHWRRVVVAACEQCGRNRVPEVLPPLTPEQFLAAPRSTPPSWQVMCDPDAAAPLTGLVGQRDLAGGMTLLVGPEGGWSPEELALAARHDVEAVRFGDRVLRTETAGIALVAALSAKLGWL